MLTGCPSGFYFTDWETLSQGSCTEKYFSSSDNTQNSETSVLSFCVAQGSRALLVVVTALCTLFLFCSIQTEAPTGVHQPLWREGARQTDLREESGPLVHDGLRHHRNHR